MANYQREENVLDNSAPEMFETTDVPILLAGLLFWTLID